MAEPERVKQKTRFHNRKRVFVHEKDAFQQKNRILNEETAVKKRILRPKQPPFSP